MKSSCTTFVFSALLAASIMATCTMSAETSSKPLFTDYPPFLCVGGSFVAMTGINMRDPVVVIPIDVNGIEPPLTMPAVGDEVIGMLCSESKIELLVRDYKSDRLIMPLYAVETHYESPTTIREEQREYLDLPKAGPTAPAAVFREGALQWTGYSWHGTTGDWHVGLPDVPNRPYKSYEVHFVHTETVHQGRGATSKLAVDLLEETLDGKVTRTVPLVRKEVEEFGD
jgi:hypothetical protein